MTICYSINITLLNNSICTISMYYHYYYYSINSAKTTSTCSVRPSSYFGLPEISIDSLDGPEISRWFLQVLAMISSVPKSRLWNLRTKILSTRTEMQFYVCSQWSNISGTNTSFQVLFGFMWTLPVLCSLIFALR